MTKTTTMLMVTVGFVLAGAPLARAQAAPPLAPRVFAGVSLGGQLQTRTITTSASSALYDETLTVASSQTIGRGFVFDISGGVFVWRRLGVGVGVSRFQHSSAPAITAVIPDPHVFNRSATVTLTGTDLQQTNVAINLQAVWTLPISDRLEVSLAGGPSFIRVSQDMPSVAVAPGTQTATVSASKEQDTTARAGNGGVDIRYRLTDTWLAGVLIRYVGGQVDLPSAPRLSVGGVQVLGGVRYQF